MSGSGNKSRGAKKSAVAVNAANTMAGGAIQIVEDGVLGIDPATLSSMSDDEFADVMTNSLNVDMPNFLMDSASQKFIYATGMNGMPDVVDDAQFDAMVKANNSTVLYRTVDEFKDTQKGVYMSAKDIQEQTMYGDLSRIGAGRMGDGFYFADDKSESLSYGHTRGDIKKTAVIRAALNSKAKIITEGQLSNLYYSARNGNGKLAAALKAAEAQNKWGNARMEFATKLGYNVVYSKSDGYYNIIDRSVLTISKGIGKK